MFLMKRNQIVITALVVMIAVAGYLQYSDSKQTKTAGILLSDDGAINPLVSDKNIVTVSKDLSNENILAEESIIAEENIIATTPEDNTILLAPEDSANTENILEETPTAIQPATENEVTTDQTTEQTQESGEAIFVNSSLDDSFFIQAKLVREQDRSRQREVLTDMINNKNITQDQKGKYADEMLGIQKRIEKESAAEAMIEAKGFKEVYVRIDDETVDVVVGKEVLTDAEIAQIEDIVKRKTGMNVTQIRISPMKK